MPKIIMKIFSMFLLKVPEVKMRKVSSDATRPGSLKKLKVADSKNKTSGPSPVKATYRPVSMPVMDASIEDMMAAGHRRHEMGGEKGIGYFVMLRFILK